ncbi:hypothetical protein PR048_026246 [Dryococelus australis]|uniref:Uncharacterized protein n=1 Tax=Dryococelus australis TaxID=614101 RepID=A0ABQ9GKT9_9NEOP|nr:hypothetical protein PR048_026246 [Dryococelus australis]
MLMFSAAGVGGREDVGVLSVVGADRKVAHFTIIHDCPVISLPAAMTREGGGAGETAWSDWRCGVCNWRESADRKAPRSVLSSVAADPIGARLEMTCLQADHSVQGVRHELYCRICQEKAKRALFGRRPKIVYGCKEHLESNPVIPMKPPYDRVKRCRERKINIKASERVNLNSISILSCGTLSPAIRDNGTSVNGVFMLQTANHIAVCVRDWPEQLPCVYCALRRYRLFTLAAKRGSPSHLVSSRPFGNGDAPKPTTNVISPMEQFEDGVDTTPLISRSSGPMRVIEVNMVRRRNEGAGETGDLRENPPTNGIVQHDFHLRKSGDPAGDGTRFASAGGEGDMTGVVDGQWGGGGVSRGAPVPSTFAFRGQSSLRSHSVRYPSGLTGTCEYKLFTVEWALFEALSLGITGQTRDEVGSLRFDSDELRSFRRLDYRTYPKESHGHHQYLEPTTVYFEGRRLSTNFSYQPFIQWCIADAVLQAIALRILELNEQTLENSPSIPLTRKHANDGRCNTIRSELEPKILNRYHLRSPEGSSYKGWMVREKFDEMLRKGSTYFWASKMIASVFRRYEFRSDGATSTIIAMLANEWYGCHGHTPKEEGSRWKSIANQAKRRGPGEMYATVAEDEMIPFIGLGLEKVRTVPQQHGPEVGGTELCYLPTDGCHISVIREK